MYANALDNEADLDRPHPVSTSVPRRIEVSACFLRGVSMRAICKGNITAYGASDCLSAFGNTTGTGGKGRLRCMLSTQQSRMAVHAKELVRGTTALVKLAESPSCLR